MTVDQGDHIPSTLMAALSPGMRLAANSSTGGSSILTRGHPPGEHQVEYFDIMC